MEDLKEMFAQMLKFKMESQRKKKKTKKPFNFRKKTKNLKKRRKTTTTLERKRRKNLKNEEKQQQFFLELQKRQDVLFTSLSNNQPTDSTTIFTQNAVWNALETFSYAPDEDKTFETYYKRYKDIYITDCADWTDAKKSPTTSEKARNRRTQQVCRLYLTKKKKITNMAFWKQLNYCQNYSAPKRLYSTKDGNIST